MEQSPPFRVDATLTGREPHDRPKPQSSWWSRRTRNQKAAGASIAVLAAIGLATSGGGSDSTQVAGRSLERSATQTTVEAEPAAHSEPTATSTTSTTVASTTTSTSVTTSTVASSTTAGTPFANCAELEAAGFRRITARNPRFTEALDRDGDGVGCESDDPAATSPASAGASGPSGSDISDIPPYENCDDARAAGAAPLRRGERGYNADLDRDGDGDACEEEEEPVGLMSPAPPPTPAPTTPPPPPPTQPPPTAPPATAPPAAAPGPFANCREAREAGAAPVRAGTPGYGPHLDRDGDGVACE